jgi:hypothetical protein
VIYTEEDGLSCRWLQEYFVGTDQLITRFDAMLPQRGGLGLREPRTFNHITPEVIEFALEFHADQIEECKRRAREQPGQQFSVQFHITHDEMARRRYGRDSARIGSQLRVRLPADFQVREGPDFLYGHMHVRPEWAAGVYGIDYAEAEAKSLELLKSWLSPQQRKDYEQHNYFAVQGSDTGTHYRLVRERSYNILELDAAGAPTGQKFCVVPAQSVAMGDQLLAQKIWLETDEKRTLKIANKLVRTSDTSLNLAARNMITREAIQLFQNTNHFLRNINLYAEVVGEPEDDSRA